MVRSSRQIKTRADVYGGYYTDNERTIVASDDLSRVAVEEPEARTSESILISDAPAVRSEPAPKSQLNMYTTLDTATEQEQEIPARPQKERKPRAKEDLMPTIKTLVYGDNATERDRSEETATQPRTRAALDAKYKVMLTIYVTIALVLAIAVIVTGVYISGATADAAAVSGALAQKQAVIAQQETTIAELLDETNIYEQARDNGMVTAGEAQYTVDRVDKVDVPQTPPLTNGFDEFCDGFGQVLM